MWFFAGLFVGLAAAGAPEIKANGAVVLDGAKVAVHWDDGDTFTVVGKGTKARLDGFNTLESYGAVHRFGPGEDALYNLAKKAGKVAMESVWNCTTQEGSGGYGRVRVACPELRKTMLQTGLGHVFSVGGPADEAGLADQRVAVEAGLGMWEGGAPTGLVTSVHSLDEKPGQSSTYNRILNLETGEAAKHAHAKVHAACSWVCEQGSCLLYVPYKQRYGDNKAECLK